MDFTKLLNIKYIFVNNPAPFHFFERGIVMAVCGLLVLAAAVAWFWQRDKTRNLISRKIASKFFNYGIVVGLLGWLLFFIREQGVYFFSRRFWFLFLFISALVWLFYLLKYILKKAPAERQGLKEKEEFERYLPRKKN